MTEESWGVHQKHRAQVIRDRESAGEVGFWLGLCDENLEPLFDLPLPLAFSAPETRGAPTSAFFTFVVPSVSGLQHPLSTELIAELGSTENGQLVPSSGPTRYVVFEAAGGVRRHYRITHALASGEGDSPSTIEIHAVDGLTQLNRFVAFSSPTSIGGEWTRFTRDWVGDPSTRDLFDRPRDIKGFDMAAVADGATLTGPAMRVLHTVLSRSIESGFSIWGKPQRIFVEPLSSEADSTPVVAYTADDGYLWDSIGSLALQAGIHTYTRLYWPGDYPPSGSAITQPVVYVHLEKTTD